MMFTYIKLKNFMSFKDAVFDLRHGSKGTKKFIAIYGENGSGKSNFVNSINLLRRSIDSFKILVNAEKAGDNVKRLAREEADMIVSDAKHNASRIVNESLLKAERIENEAEMLKKNIEIFKRKLKIIVDQQAAIVEGIETLELTE